MGDRLLTMGRIVGVFGVEGWLKIESHTDPRVKLADYLPWQLRSGTGERTVAAVTLKPQGKGLIAKLDGIDDRDQAAAWVGAAILVPREHLPRAEHGSWYWADLEGLRVVTIQGVDLGEVAYLFATGANDVLVTRGERDRLLPFIDGVIVSVNLSTRRIEVDWDPDF